MFNIINLNDPQIWVACIISSFFHNFWSSYMEKIFKFLRQ